MPAVLEVCMPADREENASKLIIIHMIDLHLILRFAYRLKIFIVLIPIQIKHIRLYQLSPFFSVSRLHNPIKNRMTIFHHRLQLKMAIWILPFEVSILYKLYISPHCEKESSADVLVGRPFKF